MATIHPVVDDGLGNTAYMVELGDGRVLVIDPARDPTPYLELARWRRLQLAYVAETHGHAPEHVSSLLLDGRRPLALFSGGALRVGTVPRTDLAGPALTEPLARAAYRSLHQRLLPLPDQLTVYPTHGAGSFCPAPAEGERTTTIGAERRHN